MINENIQRLVEHAKLRNWTPSEDWRPTNGPNVGFKPSDGMFVRDIRRRPHETKLPKSIYVLVPGRQEIHHVTSEQISLAQKRGEPIALSVLTCKAQGFDMANNLLQLIVRHEEGGGVID
ncbi:hypothetical protein HY572_04985 [Candidatus Micrarchaeota archaeon]|nr:hypothetical protein [Candidatus Micrarchaeota archaeon]